MLVYLLTLPLKQNPESFAQFMKDEYIPAVHKGPTRVGQVTSLSLQQGTTTDGDHEFLWEVGWEGLRGQEGLRVDDEDVQKKFEAFGVKLKLIGEFQDVAEWSESRT